MARLVKSEINQNIYCDVKTFHTDGSVDVRRLAVGEVAEGLRYVSGKEVVSVTGKVTGLTQSITKVSPVSVKKPVDYFAKDVTITKVIMDASEEYASKIVNVTAREIVEDAGVEDVECVHSFAYPIVTMVLTYSNGEVVEQSLEVGDVLKDIRIMTSPRQPDITGTFEIGAFAYVIKKKQPVITGVYLVPTTGGNAIKADLAKIIAFEEVPHVDVDDPTSLGSIAAALEESETGEVFAKLAVDVTIPVREDGRITSLFINEGQKLEVDLNGHAINCQAYAFYVNGGELVISDTTGNGGINVNIPSKTYPAVQVVSGGKCTMTGGFIDSTSIEDVMTNWLYGVVCSGDGIFEMTGGEMRLGNAAGISITNGTAEGVGAQFTIGGDSVIRCSDCACVYLADNKSVVVKDNAKLYGGIIARMGTISVEDRAYVEGCAVDCTPELGIGAASIFSGCTAVAAPLTAYLGIYNSSLGNDFDAYVAPSAKLVCNKADSYPVAMALVNTKYDQKADVVIDSSKSLNGGADKYHVYSHDELAASAAGDGKTMPPEAYATDLRMSIDGQQVYPVVGGN